MQSELQAQGFDYTYDKTLYDLITADNLDNVRGHISGSSLPYLTHSAHCTYNPQSLLNVWSCKRSFFPRTVPLQLLPTMTNKELLLVQTSSSLLFF